MRAESGLEPHPTGTPGAFAGLAHWRIARTAEGCLRRAWHELKVGRPHRDQAEIAALIPNTLRGPVHHIAPDTPLAEATRETLSWIARGREGAIYGARLVAGASYTELLLERTVNGALYGLIPRGTQHPGRARKQAEPIAGWHAAVLARHGVEVQRWFALHPRPAPEATSAELLHREPIPRVDHAELGPIEALAALSEEPQPTPGRHCHYKHDPCPMIARCGAPKSTTPPPDPRAARLDALEPLSRRSGPFAYLDFEFFAPLVPIAPDHRPRGKLPVQFSVHLGTPRAVEHHEWLVPEARDPRRMCAEALARALAHEPTLVVWGRDEADMLRALATHAPQQRDLLHRLASTTLDLQRVVSGAWPKHRRASLKRIAPALSPGFGWSDLDIRGGYQAARAWADLYRLPPDAPRVAALREQLRRYGRRDTEALVVVHRALDALFAGSSG